MGIKSRRIAGNGVVIEHAGPCIAARNRSRNADQSSKNEILALMRYLAIFPFSTVASISLM
jgi:hypothetical protein